MALGELEAARRDLAEFLEARKPDEAAVLALCRRAHRVSDRAVRRPPRRGRSRAPKAHASWRAFSAGRELSGIHGIQMFSIRREQGRLAELAPVIAASSRAATPRRRVAPRPVGRCSSSSAWRTRLDTSSCGFARWARAVPRGALARVAHRTSPTHAPRWVTRSSPRSSARAGALRRNRRGRRTWRRLLRRGGSLPRHARRHAR